MGNATGEAKTRTSTALPQEERSALRHELEADPTYAPWIDALVPGLSASFFALCGKHA
jgi:hypothetical protein